MLHRLSNPDSLSPVYTSFSKLAKVSMAQGQDGSRYNRCMRDSTYENVLHIASEKGDVLHEHLDCCAIIAQTKVGKTYTIIRINLQREIAVRDGEIKRPTTWLDGVNILPCHIEVASQIGQRLPKPRYYANMAGTRKLRCRNVAKAYRHRGSL
jgi:hypothetical protein